MTSYGEKLLRMYIKRCFPKCVQEYNYRKTGIVNSDTGQPLEIDIYLPEIKVGFEFHGRQHRTDEYQRFKDKQKRKQCKELNIILFEIWTATLEQDIHSIIKEKIGNIPLLKKPKLEFRKWFTEKAEQYKKNIYSMNKGINSDTFVKRRNACKK